MRSSAVTILLSLAVILATFPAAASNWTNSASGFWQDAFSWDKLPDNTQIARITNAANKTVTINATTVATAANTMTIQKLELWSPQGATTTNTLSLSNAGTVTPLDVLTSVEIDIGGLLTITNSVVQVDQTLGTDFTLVGG